MVLASISDVLTVPNIKEKADNMTVIKNVGSVKTRFIGLNIWVGYFLQDYVL
ncbi:hypothetical protein [Leuconostoc rapi]|uniref:hypothetical protein n=1 Tax=Leuconostoc rapi TaxID=1406906 RepID=UPI0039ED3054